MEGIGWSWMENSKPRIEGQRKGMERKKWYFLMWPGALGGQDGEEITRSEEEAKRRQERGNEVRVMC